MFPSAAHFADVGALGDLAFAADDAAEALELLGHALVQLDDIVEGVGDLAFEPVEIDRQACREVALFERGESAEEFGFIELGGTASATCAGQERFDGGLAIEDFFFRNALAG